MDEMTDLIDELVSKAGPTVGQIKLNQDLVKVERLIELGWTPVEKEGTNVEARLRKLEETQAKILLTLAEHQKRIDECSIRR